MNNKPCRGSTPLPDHIMLSISGDAETTMTITWRTDALTEEGFVKYKSNGCNEMRKDAAFNTVKTDIDVSNIHTATLTGLKPGIEYCYTCGDNKNRSDEFCFTTEEENCKHFKFIVLADHQKAMPWEKPDYSVVHDLIKEAVKKNPDIKFIFTAGDNCDDGQNDIQWNGMFSGLKGIIEYLPYMMATGNHDNRGFTKYLPEPVGKFYLEHADLFDAQFENSYPKNGPNGYKGENYSFDYGNAHFCVMGINAPDVVGEWAKNDIAVSRKTWKIGSYHFPIYPVMPEGQNDDAYPWLRSGVELLDILFAGHEHSFARSYPIKGDEMFDKPSQGTVHYICGNSAGNIFHSNERKIWHTAFYPQEIKTPIYTLVEIDGSKMCVTACLQDGRIADKFTIDKEKDVIVPYALAPTYDRTKMAYKGSMSELATRGLYCEIIDGIWYMPFANFSRYIGADTVIDNTAVKITMYNKWAVFTASSDIAQTDNGEFKLSGKVKRADRGQFMMPVDDCTKIFNMKWKYIKRNNFIDIENNSEESPMPELNLNIINYLQEAAK